MGKIGIKSTLSQTSHSLYLSPVQFFRKTLYFVLGKNVSKCSVQLDLDTVILNSVERYTNIQTNSLDVSEKKVCSEINRKLVLAKLSESVIKWVISLLRLKESA